ncbi:MAG: hypothetical protein QME42_05570 [bacterium]|nr:hypothetical protein [bacterium]
MKKVKSRYVIDEKGKKLSVILSLLEYSKLLETIEELEDSLELEKAEREAIGFTDYMKFREELKTQGLL